MGSTNGSANSFKIAIKPQDPDVHSGLVICLLSHFYSS